MEFAFKILKTSRRNILKIVEAHSLEQLNKIPAGFNNNMIWNLGHVLVTQQLLCYALSGLPMGLSAEIIEKYRKGSAPTGPVSAEELEILKKAAIDTAEHLEADFNNKKFVTFKPYETSFGIGMKNIEEAVLFNNAHETMHLGTFLALKKMV